MSYQSANRLKFIEFYETIDFNTIDFVTLKEKIDGNKIFYNYMNRIKVSF